jgi:two-component system sensor histidine kinase EvgS
MSLNLNQKSVLIVEDELLNYTYIKDLFEFERLNVKILYAANGKEAVDICSKDRNIVLVLTDIRMPVMNGYIATKKIKEMRPELPVVAQTAYMLEMEMKEIKDVFDEYLIKPINRVIFRNVISKYCV